MKPEELEKVLENATTFPWAFYRGPKAAQISSADFELACAAVNCLPHLIELWKAWLHFRDGFASRAILETDDAISSLEGLESPRG